MAISLQAHKYVGKPKQEHNCNGAKRLKEKHIRTPEEGGFIKVLKNCNWQKEIDEVIFKNEIEQFNSKQTRKDRKKVSYYQECSDREKKEEEQVKLKHKTDQKGVFRPVHEFVFGVYGEEISQQDKIAILEQFAKEFEDKYKNNLKLLSVVIHVDEQRDLIKKGLKTAGTVDPHMHINFCPVAHNFKKGMQSQISFSGALRELGFARINRKENELVAFEDKLRVDLKQLVINYTKKNEAKLNFAQYKGEEHFEKELFIKQQELKETRKEKIHTQREIVSAINDLNAIKTEHNYWLLELEKIKNQYNKFKNTYINNILEGIKENDFTAYKDNLKDSFAAVYMAGVKAKEENRNLFIDQNTVVSESIIDFFEKAFLNKNLDTLEEDLELDL